MKSFPILYARGAGDKVLQWQIFVDGDKFWSEAGQQGGSLVAAKPTTAKPKNVGKANETSPAKQAEIEAEAKFTKKKKENYFENIADIDGGFLEPQLAKPTAKPEDRARYLDKVVWSDGQLVDKKLNGFACIITAKGAFTRTNEQYHSIPHILEQFKEFFQKNPDAYVQGELFNPVYVTKLNRISKLISVVRELKDITPELLAESAEIVQFHWYDGYGFASVTKETPLKMRRHIIDRIISGHQGDYGMGSVCKVDHKVCFSYAAMVDYAESYISTGGEGVIIKNPHAPYEHKRTKHLLKWKKTEDAEFQIVDDVPNPFVEGVGNSEGCAEAVWVFNPEGVREQDKRCKINLEGTKEHLREVYKNPEKYKGEWLTARFQERSEYEVPQIPYSDLVLREQVEGKGSINKSVAVKPKQNEFTL